jgi:hypothetical protein
MAITLTTDMILGIGVLLVTTVAIIMFLRATESTKRSNDKDEIIRGQPLVVELKPRKATVPNLPSITQTTQVEQARTQIRTLTLQQEILSMVMKRLFEAEDNEEISRAERERLCKSYEAEMKQVDEQLKKAELIVSLNDLEEIRSNIIAQFQQTLNSTQSQIDLIIKELNIQQPELGEKIEPKPKPTTRRRKPRPQKEESYEELEDEPREESEETGKKTGDTVEDRLDKLKQDVLKELEELERLELEQ